MSKEHKITAKDFCDIMSTAKGNYINTVLPMQIGKEKLTHGESVNILLLESFISYLNKNGLLIGMVKFDHIERK